MPTAPLPELPPPPPPPDIAAMWESADFQAQMAAMMAQAQAQLAALVAALAEASAQLALALPPKPPEPVPPVLGPPDLGPLDPMPLPEGGIPIDPSVLLPPGPPVFTWSADGSGEVVCGLPSDELIAPVRTIVPTDTSAQPGVVVLASELAAPAWDAAPGPLTPLPQVWEAPALPDAASASLAALLEPDAAAPWGAPVGFLFHGAEGGVF